MRRTRSPYGDLASPLVVGAATALITLVAVFLSYNANAGLPFVPTYDITAEVRAAQELVRGNEVRVGGHRVGVISAIDARLDRAGSTLARLDLKLDVSLQPLRDDSRVTIRPRSPLGLKYLQLEPGPHGRPLPPGGMLGISREQPIVDLDEVIDNLDAPTRHNLRRVLVGLGTGLAARGADFNEALEGLRPLLRDLRPVLADLADPDTRLGELVRGLAATTGELAPVARQLASLIADAETTLAALEAAGPELERTLAAAPATVETAIPALRTLRPVFAKARRLSARIAPGTRLLPATADRLAAALETGTPVLRRALRLADDLDRALEELRRLGAEVPAASTLSKLARALRSLKPTLEFAAPYQTVCNYLGIWGRNVPSAISEGDGNGTWLRFDAVGQPPEATQSAEPAPELHYNPYPNGAAPGQPRECEAGNEPLLPGQRIGNVPGDQGTVTEDTDPGGK